MPSMLGVESKCAIQPGFDFLLGPAHFLSQPIRRLIVGDLMNKESQCFRGLSVAQRAREKAVVLRAVRQRNEATASREPALGFIKFNRNRLRARDRP